MADFLVRVWAYISDVIGCQFEKMRNVHRFEDLKKDIDLRIGRRFENLEKRHRSEVHMSVTKKSDMDLRIGCRYDAGHRSESYTYL